MLNCRETRKSREFCGCDDWLDGWAHDVVGSGRNSRIVKNCNDGAEFAGSVVLSRACVRFNYCCDSDCLSSVAAYHLTAQRRQLVASAATVYRLAPLAGSCG